MPMPSEAARDRTHRMDDLYASAPMPAIRDLSPASVAAPSAPRPGRRRRRGSLTPLGVVITAVCVAGVVVGGVYLASRSTGTKDRDDDPPHAPLTATPVPATPADPPTSAPADPPPFVPPSPVPPPPPRAGPQGPRPRPSPSATPPATPSTAPSSDPSPGLVLPFPIPNPFQPAPQPPGSSTPKQQDPPPLFPLP
jgi:hypothetical protein